MGNLLLDEAPLVLLPSLAVAVGLNEAIILQQIHYWLKMKQANPDKYKDGFREERWWVYNSVEEWRKQFPFWSSDTIQRGLTSLKKRGVVIVKTLAPDPRDRTNWYTINYERLADVADGGGKVRPCTDADCGSALPQFAAMGSPQTAAVHQRKARQSLTETSAETSQRVQQQQATSPPRPPQGDADVVVVEVGDGEEAQGLPDANDPSGDGDDLTEDDKLFGNGPDDAPASAQASVSPPDPEARSDAQPPPEELLVRELVSEGMGEGQARRAVSRDYAAAVHQLENLRHALPTEALTPPSRGAWLHVAIRDGYGPTKGYAKFLADQRDKEKRREAKERRDAAQRATSEAERTPSGEADFTPEAMAALRQKARNCVPPDYRKWGEMRCARLIQVNFEALVLGKTVKEFGVWLAPEPTAEN